MHFCRKNSKMMRCLFALALGASMHGQEVQQVVVSPVQPYLIYSKPRIIAVAVTE